MIFPVLDLEDTIQVGDKTRLNATKTYITPDEAAITLIEIEPEAAAGFLDVTSSQYLDYQYSTDGVKVVTLRVTTDGSPESISKNITCITEADDKLFSRDADLLPYEPQILSWAREGRNSFLDVHREAQNRILGWLDEHRIWDTDGDRLTKDNIIDIEEVNDWSKYLTLRLIFEGISNATDDIFHEKALRYEELETRARNRAAIRLDSDGDGTQDVATTDLRSSFLVRR